MELRLYSFSKKHNSTKQLLSSAAPVATYTTVYLKQNTDIDNPTFLIDDDFHDVNYAYLVDFERYYFISGYHLGNANIYEIECELDALATYKSYILAYQAFVERCADNNHYRQYFNDEAVSVSQEVRNFDFNIKPISEFSNTGCYVIRIAGGDADGVSTFVTDNLTDLAAIFDQDTYVTSSQTEWYELLGSYTIDPWDYIVGLYWSPFSLDFYKSKGAYQAYIWVKWYNTGALAYKLPNNYYATLNITDIPRPTALYGDFRKLNPSFTRYKMFIPAVGLIDIENNEVQHGIIVQYGVNLDTGACAIMLKTEAELAEVAYFEANLYVPMQAGSDRLTVGGVLAGVGSIMSNIASGNPTGTVSAAIGAVGNVIAPTPNMIGSNGAIGLRAINDIYFISECYQSGDIPTVVYGRPCYRNLALSNFSGFVKCGNASIELPANEAVKNKINSMLNEGIYIE